MQGNLFHFPQLCFQHTNNFCTPFSHAKVCTQTKDQVEHAYKCIGLMIKPNWAETHDRVEISFSSELFKEKQNN